MNWSSVGNLLADAAPLVGTALFGPAGTAVGVGLASLFGTEPDPEKVAQAINADPEAMTKIKQFEIENQTELTKAVIQAATAELKTVNETMRVEAQSDRWWVSAWRPYWGFSSATAWAFLAMSLGVAMLSGDGVGIALSVFNAVPETFWLIPLAVLGIASWHRGQEKRTRAEGGAWNKANSLVNGVIAKVKGVQNGG